MSNPLLDLDELPAFSTIRPEHVEPAVNDVLEENRRKTAELLEQAETQTPDFESSILQLEELGDRLHRVWSPVSHLHAVANSPDLRSAYNKCLPVLARYSTEMGQNEALFRLYTTVADALPKDGSPGHYRLLELAIRDFHLAGVGLPEDKKARFKSVMEQLTQLQATFEQNVLDAMAAWTHHETSAECLAGLPGTIIEQAEVNAHETSQSGWLFRLDQPTYIGILTHADNRDLRYRIYRAWVTRASDQASSDPSSSNKTPVDAEFDNTKNIEQILALRHEAANLVGFNNFAEYSLATKMADSVTQVRTFLEDLGDKAHDAARRELEELEDFAGMTLAAWDIAYYSEKLRKKKYSVSDEELRPFFPVDTVLTGLFDLVGQIYGIQVESAADVQAWEPEVRFYRLRDIDGGELGGFYVDLFARPNKRSGAWMDECIIRKRTGDDIQHPVAHLICNFSAPTRNTPCLLTHDEVVTLFHEFGHTLHHLLTTVDYPSVSGINGVPWDAVELPSQFMENFAWEPEVIRMISGHYRTGEPFPLKLLNKLRASRVFQSGMQMMRQLEFALFDLRLHAEFVPGKGAHMEEILAEVRSAVSVTPYPDFNRFAHAFSHIFAGGYAAGYYSYKWAEVLAADAWSAFTEDGVLNPDLAKRFRHEILEIGGTVDIGDAFKAFRGREPAVEPLLIQNGILPDDDQAKRT